MCEDRVVVVTGAGRGIGRAHALAFAAQGADVVVNDLGAEVDGTGSSEGPAHEVADEVRALGRRAVVSGHDVADEAGADALIATAVEAFGRVDVVVNNAGILRDRMLVNMSFEEWDAVVRVHLRGTFGPSRAAARHWRERAKAGDDVHGRIINTSSPSGLYGNVGQTNYGAAKAGIAAFTLIAAKELARYGVTVNAIAPVAATRMTIALRGGAPPERAPGEFDPGDPANQSPLVVWLGSVHSAGVTGRVFDVRGGRIAVVEGWHAGPWVQVDRRWEPEELGEVIPDLVARAAPPADMSGSPAPPGP